jgi:hypothetical protein
MSGGGVAVAGEGVDAAAGEVDAAAAEGVAPLVARLNPSEYMDELELDVVVVLAVSGDHGAHLQKDGNATNNRP